jgi:L-rhamnose mutarotase
MRRIAFVMWITPGSAPEYERRHQAVWPEMITELKAAGCHNYSIFRDGLQLFAYLEVDDVDRFRAYLAESQVAAKWEAYMSNILVRQTDPDTNFPALLPEAFHLD